MIDEQTFEVMSSPTLGKLAKFGEDMPLDVMDREELKTALSTCVLDICRAMDAGRIHFDKAEDSAVFHGLMAINLAQFFDGKVKAEVMTKQ